MRDGAAFARKYTDEQRELIDQLKNVEGLSEREVARVCARGYGEHAPFRIPSTTVGQIARDARQRRQGKGPDLRELPTERALDQLVKRGLGLLGYQAERLERQRDRKEDIDLRQLKDFFAAGKAWSELSRPLGARAPDPTAADPNGALRELMEQAKQARTEEEE